MSTKQATSAERNKTQGTKLVVVKTGDSGFSLRLPVVAVSCLSSCRFLGDLNGRY